MGEFARRALVQGGIKDPASQAAYVMALFGNMTTTVGVLVSSMAFTAAEDEALTIGKWVDELLEQQAVPDVMSRRLVVLVMKAVYRAQKARPGGAAGAGGVASMAAGAPGPQRPPSRYGPSAVEGGLAVGAHARGVPDSHHCAGECSLV